MSRAVAPFVAGFAIALCSACSLVGSGDGPGASKVHSGRGAATSFYKFEDGVRVVEVFNRTGRFRTTVPVASSTRTFVLRMDCTGADGTITVSVGDLDGTSTCDKTDSNGKGYIGIGLRIGEEPASKVAVRVKAPKGSSWSVAVDTEPVEVETFRERTDERE